MAKYVIYDPATGAIEARVTTSDPATQLGAFSPHILEVDAADYDSAPEAWAEIDVVKRQLRPQIGKQDPTSKKRPRN